MDKGKWIIRVGALSVLLGFFLPSFAVSCSGMGAQKVEQPFSLVDLAQGSMLVQAQPALYFVLVGVLAILVFSVLKPSDMGQRQVFLWSQISGAAVGVLVLTITFISLYSNVQEYGFGMIDISPKIGMLLLVAGYGAIGVGLGIHWKSASYPSKQAGTPGPSQAVKGDQPKPSGLEDRSFEPSASLEVIRGNVGRSVINVNRPNFSIGRGSWNDLVLSNKRVSKEHARLRFAQGTWFIQDTGSTNGIRVNGELLKATSLSPGDKISIEEFEFIFRR